MTSWMDMEQFRSQMSAPGFPDLDTHQAPCPSDFPEGDSYWIKNFPFPAEAEASATPIPAEADIVIIGSGITGATVAYRLAQRHPTLRVAMLEARSLCSGATGRNGGHIARAEAYDIRHVAKTAGAEDAVRARQMITRNRDMMLEAIEELGVADEIDLRLTGSVAIFGSAEERESFEQDVAFAEKLGAKLEGYVLSEEEVLKKLHVSPEIAKHGAACIDKAGSMYPRKFIAALIRHVSSRMTSFSVHPFTPVQSVSKEASEAVAGQPPGMAYSVVTKKGTVRCRAIVHATNAYAGRLAPSLVGRGGVFGCKCEVIAIQPNTPSCAEFPIHGGFGYDQVWHWIVQRPDNGPLIYGWSGIEQLLDYDDSKTLPESHESRDYMCRWLEGAFPKQFEDVDWSRDVNNSWSGIQGFTMDGSSLVGHPTKDSPGEFMSVGHNGEGMGRCFACATVLVDKILYYLDGKDGDAPWAAPDWFPRSFLRNV